MEQDIIDLKKEFERIKKLGWIESKRKGTTGIGYTFETLLNKPEENFEIPDFGKIEIKTKHRYSKGYITLFNATPDGDELFAIHRLQKKFGYPDKDLTEQRVFKGSVTCNNFTNIGLYYKFKLIVDKDLKLIRLIVVNKSEQLIDDKTSWSFELIQEKLERKLQYLALIHSDSKIINGKEFFKYTNIEFYKFNNFDKFIKAINNGLIRITFKVGVFKSGPKKGNIHDHGTGVDINEKNLLSLYTKIK